MINKNTFLSSFALDTSHKRNAVNQLVFDWHEDEDNWTKSHPNDIKQEFEDGLRKAIRYWLYLFDAEAEGFRDSRHNKAFHKMLKRVILDDEAINYFGILCPSYKKEINGVGFSVEPGNTTYRAFHNLLRMAEVTRGLGIRSDYRMFFSDISLERAEHFKAKDWQDLQKIITMDGIIGKALSVPYQTLTQLDHQLETEVGAVGKIVDINELPVDPKAVERAMWRDRQFYPRMFGWDIKEAEQRTLCHAHSYYWQGEIIRQHFKNPVMVYSAYDYEKGALYNGPDGSYEPCIIYPLKNDDNPPLATLPPLAANDLSATGK